MAGLNKFSITIEIEPIVRLVCMNTDCIFNLAKYDLLCCNLKHIELDGNGVCERRELKLTGKPVMDEHGLARTDTEAG